MPALKIKPEHMAVIQAAVVPLDTPARRAQYKAGDFPNAARVRDLDMRYRWDLLWASGIRVGDGVGTNGLPLYEYLNDTHIDSALRSIIKPLT